MRQGSQRAEFEKIRERRERALRVEPRPVRRARALEVFEDVPPVLFERGEGVTKDTREARAVGAEVAPFAQRRPRVDDGARHREEAVAADPVEAVRLHEGPLLQLHPGRVAPTQGRGFAVGGGGEVALRAREFGSRRGRARDADDLGAGDEIHERFELERLPKVLLRVAVRRLVLRRRAFIVRPVVRKLVRRRLGGDPAAAARLLALRTQQILVSSRGEASNGHARPPRDDAPELGVRVGRDVDRAPVRAHEHHRVLQPRRGESLPLEQVVPAHAREQVVERVHGAEVLPPVATADEEEAVDAERGARRLDATEATQRVVRVERDGEGGRDRHGPRRGGRVRGPGAEESEGADAIVTALTPTSTSSSFFKRDDSGLTRADSICGVSSVVSTTTRLLGRDELPPRASAHRGGAAVAAGPPRDPGRPPGVAAFALVARPLAVAPVRGTHPVVFLPAARRATRCAPTPRPVVPRAGERARSSSSSRSRSRASSPPPRPGRPRRPSAASPPSTRARSRAPRREAAAARPRPRPPPSPPPRRTSPAARG